MLFALHSSPEDYSKANYSYPLPEDSSFKEVLNTLSSKGVHRVPIVSSKGALVRLITQSEVLRFVSQNLDDFGSSLDKSVLLAGLLGKATVYVKETQPTLDAFTAIVEKRVRPPSLLRSPLT